MKIKFVTNHLHLKRVFASLVTAGSTLVLLLGSIQEDYRNQEEDKVRRYEAQKAVVDEMVARYKAETEARASANTETYTTGFVSTCDEAESSIMYVETHYSSLNVRLSPNSESAIIGTLENGAEVTVVADSTSEAEEYVEIEYDGGTAYIHSNFITDIQPEPVALACAPEIVESSSTNTNSNTTEYTIEYTQDGDLVLNSDLGRIQGPSGEETYYNLNMSKVVENAHNLGIEGEYNVREDGVKCLGDYVMVAANLDVHPRGSLVETSVGVGVVVDSGDFAKTNPTQLDIATNW